MMEAGVKDYDVALWIAYVAPAGTPDAIVARLNRAMNEILNEPDLVANLQKQGFEPDPDTPQALSQHIAEETAKWRAWWQRPASSRSDPPPLARLSLRAVRLL